MVRKKFVILIGIIVIIVLGLAVYLKKLPFTANQNKSSFRTTVERNLTPDDRNIYNTRIKESEKALAELKPGPNYASDKARIYNFLGQSYFGLGELSKSQNNYEEALKLTPNNSNIWTGLFTTKLDRLDFEGALEAIQKARDLTPSDPYIWIRYLELKRQKFDSDFADQNGLFKDALNATANKVDLLVAYANFLEDNGKLKEAQEEWQAAVKASPENQSYKQELVRIENLLKK